MIAFVWAVMGTSVQAGASDVPAMVFAQNQLVSPALISQIQSQFKGQVVGVNDQGQTADVQVLRQNGSIVVVTVDKASNSIINVKQ
jgi:hypothetical protein